MTTPLGKNNRDYFDNKTFVGRYNECLELDSILKKERVCIVSGAAGIGKTAFVMHFLFEYKKESRDDVCITHLSDIQSQAVEWEAICGNEIIIVDDIDDILNFLRSSIYHYLLDTLADSLIFITRDSTRVPSIPSIILKALSQEEAFLLIDLELQDQIEKSGKEILISLSQSNPLLLQLLIHIYRDHSISIDEISYQWTLPENKKLLDCIIRTEIKLPILDKEELLFLQKLIVLGDIEISLLLRWSKEERSDQIIHRLINKGVVTLSNKHVIQTKAENRDYSIVEYESLTDIEESILSDMKNGISVDEKYPERIIEFIKEQDATVSFVADYYHLKFQKKNHEVNDVLKEVLLDVKALRVTQNETLVTVKNIEERTDDFYGFLCSILDQLKTISPDDTEVLEKLEELKNYALHPKKGLGERAYAAIGFLGSMASIASSPQGAQLLILLKDLFKLILMD